MTTRQVTSQSAADRRSAEAALRGLIIKFAPAHHRLVDAVRRSLLKRLPTAQELIYEYRDCFAISCSPSEHGYEGVFAIRGSAKGIELHFNRGKELPDPEKLLTGSGKLVRSILLEGASTLIRPPVARLIDEAIARNRVPFPRSGRGAVTVRLGAAAKRRKTVRKKAAAR